MIRKTLVVNDDSTSLLVACKMISKAAFSCETVTANDARSALTYFDDAIARGKEHFDEVPEFIFLDMYMPVMSGWDFLDVFSKKYAATFPLVKVAIMSSSVDDEDMQRLEKYAVVLATVTVPISLEKLGIVKNMYQSEKHRSCFYTL